MYYHPQRCDPRGGEIGLIGSKAQFMSSVASGETAEEADQAQNASPVELTEHRYDLPTEPRARLQ